MAVAGEALARLQSHLHQTRLLGSISSALYYDQNTVMPAEGAAWRGEQLALLAGQLHERQSSPEYADLVAAAEAELGAEAPPEPKEAVSERNAFMTAQLLAAVTREGTGARASQMLGRWDLYGASAASILHW